MKLYMFLALLLVNSLVNAQNTIEVEVTNITNNKGIIGIALYDNARDFTTKEIASTTVKAKKGKVIAYFKNIPAGEYAIAILHDKNENDKMDFNLLGIPKEKYGFSNNAKGFMSVPKFEKAVFSVIPGQVSKQSIRL